MNPETPNTRRGEQAEVDEDLEEEEIDLIVVYCYIILSYTKLYHILLL